MTNKKVAVIGAGIGGLSAAVRLQKLGYQVSLFEKENQVGGKMNQINEEGFKFDVGPTIVMMKDIYEEVFEFAGVDPNDYLPFEKVDPAMKLYFDQNKSMKISTDLPDLIKNLESISEEDANGYLKFLSAMYDRYLVAKNHFLTRSYRSFRDFYNWSSLYNGLKLKTLSDAYSSISKFVKDENLKKSLAFQTLYIGISPYQGPSLYNIIPMIELFYGIYYLKGGMYTVAKAMEKLFKQLGGEVYLNSSVDEIVIENKKTEGIRINDKILSFDDVVCDADFPYAVKNLIKNKKYKGKYTDKKIEKMEYSCSCFLLYLGLDKKYEVDSLHTIHFAKDFNKNIDDLFKNNRLPDDPSYYIYVPSKMDDSVAPKDNEAVYVLVPVPELSKFDDWSDASIKEYRNLILDKIKSETNFKDIDEHIIYENHYTPKDFEIRFNAYNGATFGLKPTLMQSNYYRPHNKYNYADNLYFCGSSTHPGAGVPIVMQGAKLAVEELLKDEG
ncbi:phytoene desaturase [Lactobacillus sp. S2-2]|uniref:phytoene desaturase family protein n=1 Tax=Lactobacillus sp. S2-2 TaxID=2692917 RepID=UPI001F02BA21|nr:phytoene desaturase family protein [Lactobacillus sp. S2-2]MCF6515009.1 phytoene desaturase [Lactobacillus sp. S2-2]